MLRTGKRAKIVGNLLHISSYREANILQTERQTHGWLNNTQNVAFFSGPILITSWSCKKRFQALPAYTFAFLRNAPHCLSILLCTVLLTFLWRSKRMPHVYIVCCIPMLGWTGIHKHVTRRFSGTLTLLTFFSASKFSRQLTSRIVNLSAGIIWNIILH